MNWIRKIENKIALMLDHLVFWVQRIWYITLLVLSSVYVGCNFEECIDMTFFENFDGKNILFLFWILLLVLPLIRKFEVFGVNVELNEAQKSITSEYEKLFAEQEQKEQVE